jgi:hypothetical protein
MNPLLTSALLSTGKQVIDHCLTKVDKESTEGEEFSRVLNKKIEESFDVPRYMQENGLQTPEEVVQHIQELKARLLESRDIQNTALHHQEPNATIIISRDGGYSVRNGDLEVTVAVDSQAHGLAKAIHHLECWRQSR